MSRLIPNGGRFALYFAGCLFCFALFRGLSLSAALMPFEGWDEYQHVGVAQFVYENGHMPTLDDTLPPDMWPYLRSHPHPEFGYYQIKGLGGVAKYTDPASAMAVPALPQPPRLYQAQHGPLFYGLMAWLKKVFSISDYSDWTDLGRGLNVFWGALSVVLWFFILRACCIRPSLRLAPYCTALLMASNSLFYYNHARVANDPLAIMLASLALFIYFYVCKPRPNCADRNGFILSCLLGLLTGLAVLAKTTALILLPVFFAALLWQAFSQKKGWLRAAALLGALLLGYLAAAAPYHLQNYARYGMMVAEQHGLHNAAKGIGLARLLVEILPALPWLDLKEALLVHLHVGGWSFSYTYYNYLSPLYKVLLLAGWGCMAAGLWGAFKRGKAGDLVRPCWELALLGAVSLTAMVYHSVQCFADKGFQGTLPHYGTLAFPALTAFCLMGGFMFRRWLGLALSAAFWAMFNLSYYQGTFGDLLRIQTGAKALWEGLAQIAGHHGWLGALQPEMLYLEIMAGALATCMTVYVIFRRGRAG